LRWRWWHYPSSRPTARHGTHDIGSHCLANGARFHYQLNFSNEIVDIVCQTAPIVSLRRAVIQDKLAGEAQ
jgi:hypothetical protein